MILSAFQANSKEVIIVEIPPDKSTNIWFFNINLIAKDIQNVFNGDYNLLIDRMQIINNKLIILAPNSVISNIVYMLD